MYSRTKYYNFSLIALVFLTLTLGCGPTNPTPYTPPSQSPPLQSPTPEPNFKFSIWVRDRDNNSLIGQAKVYLAVGSQVVEQKVTDEAGQASFEVSSSYSGKEARFYAEHRNYYPNDLTVKLGEDTRHIIFMTNLSVPKIDPNPPKPTVSEGQKTTPQAPIKQNIEMISVGGEKTGAISEDQTKDYQFNADKNNPILFTARCDTDVKEKYRYFVQIFDSQGKNLKKQEVICGASVKEIPFTPPDTGSYIVRIKGTDFYGNFFLYFNSN